MLTALQYAGESGGEVKATSMPLATWERAGSDCAAAVSSHFALTANCLLLSSGNLLITNPRDILLANWLASWRNIHLRCDDHVNTLFNALLLNNKEFQQLDFFAASAGGGMPVNVVAERWVKLAIMLEGYGLTE